MDEKKNLQKLSSLIEYMVKKRDQNIQYLIKAFTEGVFWLNSVQLYPELIVSKMDPNELREMSVRYYNLGLSLGRLIDLSLTSNLVNCLLELFGEYEGYYFKKTKKINRLVLMTQKESFQSFGKAKEEDKNRQAKYKSNVASLKQNFLVPKEDKYFDFPPSFPEPGQYKKDPKYPTLFLESPISDYDRFQQITSYPENPPKVKSNHSKSKLLHMLVIGNTPFNLDLNEVVINLCRIVSLIYNKFYNQSSLTPSIVTDFRKIDGFLNNYLIKPLTFHLNQTATALLNDEFNKLHTLLIPEK